MKAIKFIDTAGNVDYVRGNSIEHGSLVKASIADKPYKGFVSSMFFSTYSDLYEYLENNSNKIIIGKGCICSPLKNGNSRDNHLYNITKN